MLGWAGLTQECLIHPLNRGPSKILDQVWNERRRGPSRSPAEVREPGSVWTSPPGSFPGASESPGLGVRISASHPGSTSDFGSLPAPSTEWDSFSPGSLPHCTWASRSGTEGGLCALGEVDVCTQREGGPDMRVKRVKGRCQYRDAANAPLGSRTGTREPPCGGPTSWGCD